MNQHASNQTQDDQPQENAQPKRAPSKNSLTIWTKRIIGLIWYINIISFIAWPVVVLVVGMNIPEAVEDRHTDINVLLGYQIYPEVMTDTTQPSISGGGNMLLNNTYGYAAWYYAGAVPTIMSMFVLTGLYQLRKIFASLAAGHAFTQEIPQRIKKFGFVLIAWSIIIPFVQYFVGAAVLSDIQFKVPDVELSAAFDLYPGFFVSGLAIIVLSRVFQEAKTIHDEQALTI